MKDKVLARYMIYCRTSRRVCVSLPIFLTPSLTPSLSLLLPLSLSYSLPLSLSLLFSVSYSQLYPSSSLSIFFKSILRHKYFLCAPFFFTDHYSFKFYIIHSTSILSTIRRFSSSTYTPLLYLTEIYYTILYCTVLY